MMKKRGCVVLCIVLYLLFSIGTALAQLKDFNPNLWEYNDPNAPYDQLSPSQVHQLDITQVPDTKVPVIFDKLSDAQKQQLSGPQLTPIPDAQLGDLGQYNPPALSQSFQSKGYDVQELRGDFAGAAIQDQKITLADGSSYDLKTGKKVTLEAATGSTKYFSDTDNTVIINGIGVQYSKDTLTVQSADSIDYKTANLQKPLKFSAQQYTFTVETADRVQIGEIKFDKIKDSTFTVQIPNTLVTAGVTSAVNTNSVLFPNPIAITPFFQINYDQDRSFSIAYTKTLKETSLPEPYGPDTRIIDIVLKNSTVLFGNILTDNTFQQLLSFAPFTEDAELILIDAKPPILKLKQGQLNYTTPTFTESISSFCQFTTAQYSSGFTLITLAPFLETLCPGAQYAYYDHQTKQSSFNIINTGKDLYELYLNKNDVWNLQDLEKSDDRSWGFIDLPSSLSLFGIIQYGRIREFQPEIESAADYQQTTLPFMPVYTSSDANNQVLLTLHGKEFGMSLKEAINPLTTTYATTNSGAHKMTEQLTFSKIATFHDYNKQPQSPPYLIEYASAVQNLALAQQTLVPACPESTQLFNPLTGEGNAFQERLTAMGAVAYDSYLKKYGKSLR